MARNTLEKVRDCMGTGKPEITWQPEFDRAKEVLARSLLNPPVTPRRPSARGLSRRSGKMNRAAEKFSAARVLGEYVVANQAAAGLRRTSRRKANTGTAVASRIRPAGAGTTLVSWLPDHKVTTALGVTELESNHASRSTGVDRNHWPIAKRRLQSRQGLPIMGLQLSTVANTIRVLIVG